jgi:hypothetical protein
MGVRRTMCTDDFDWYGSYVTVTRDTEYRCGCGRTIPAGVPHSALIEDVNDYEAECRWCDGSGQAPFVDDYGNEIRPHRVRFDSLNRLAAEWGALTFHALDRELERPCAAPTCDDGIDWTHSREPEEDHLCGLCSTAMPWLEHHCSGQFSSHNIPGQIAEHSQELEWPSYQDRALIAAADQNWRGYDESCIRGLVRVATAPEVAGV